MNDIKNSGNEKNIEDRGDERSVRMVKFANWLTWNNGILPNKFKPDISTEDILSRYNSGDSFDDIRVKVAGRIVLKRVMGKASFIHIQDESGRIQAYLQRDSLQDSYTFFSNEVDLGDIVGIEGLLFRTKTKELTIKVEQIMFLTKAIRPMPEKFHGLSDKNTRYRQRYLDLLSNSSVRDVFKIRTKIINFIRKYLVDRDYLEVETPMMHASPGGAIAKPFKTHHNALDMQLFMRIAPELHLKRLLVGGYERVFEINRNFRNEGISTRHNPEFTMIEFYEAYATFEDLMVLTEDLLKKLTFDLFGKLQVSYQGIDFDMSKEFSKMTLVESVLKYNPELSSYINDVDYLRNYISEKYKVSGISEMGLGKLQVEIFEQEVESNLIQPTFITHYPKEVSPLARVNDKDNHVTDRFEFFIAGREIANSFSELNDPIDQSNRLKQQLLEQKDGNDEAMSYDDDYIKALEHGMPPCAGEGIGIDRLVMFFTDQSCIRDVILFPLLKSED